MGVVDFADEFGNITLGFGGGIGAVELGDLAEQAEALGVLLHNPGSGHEEEFGGFAECAGGFAVEIAPGELAVAPGLARE